MYAREDFIYTTTTTIIKPFSNDNELLSSDACLTQNRIMSFCSRSKRNQNWRNSMSLG